MDYLKVADLGVDGLKHALELSIRSKDHPGEFADALSALGILSARRAWGLRGIARPGAQRGGIRRRA